MECTCKSGGCDHKKENCGLLVLEYSELGKAYSDFTLFEDANSILDAYLNDSKEEDFRVCFCTESLTDFIRLAAMLRKVDNTKMVFVFKGVKMFLDNRYNFTNSIYGFGTKEEEVLRSLRVARRSEESFDDMVREWYGGALQ